jgi:hypothetical protein
LLPCFVSSFTARFDRVVCDLGICDDAWAGSPRDAELVLAAWALRRRR